MAGLGLVSGIGGLDKSHLAREGVEGAPSTCGIERRQGEGLDELGQVGMTFETTEAGLDVQQGGDGPARDLVGGGMPPGDFGGLATIVAHRVLDRVGRQQRHVERRRHVEPVQGDELITGFVQTGQAAALRVVHQAALDDRVGRGGKHRGLQRRRAIKDRKEAMTRDRRETARLQARDQRLRHRSVLAA